MFLINIGLVGLIIIGVILILYDHINQRLNHIEAIFENQKMINKR